MVAMSRERQYLSKNYQSFSQLFVILLLLLTTMPAVFAAPVTRVIIISTPENSAHKEFIAAFRKELSRTDPELNIVEQSIEEYNPNSNNTLLVTLGSSAFKETASLGGKKLHTLISHAQYKEIYPTDVENSYHLVFNQPLARILRFQQLALPDSKYIGILLGRQYPEFAQRLSSEVEKMGKQLITEQVGDNFSVSLSSLLSKIDSLLLFPDASVINRETINTLVLDSYHKQIPLLGYSKALVKAGAMLAIYSTPVQLGEEGAVIASRIIAGKDVPLHLYPKNFEISVNYQLSRVYEINIPSEAELHKQVMAGEQ
jgi:putative ABC transport system substrate-binding protein